MVTACVALRYRSATVDGHIINPQNMDLQLKDKAALVTGGAKGIGAAITRTCAREGAIAVARRPGRAGVSAVAW